MADEHMIAAQNLAKVFRGPDGNVRAVKGVDLSVQGGEVVALLGPNGAGKTTTMRMLTTLLRPTSGAATVAGRNLRTDPTGVRRRIGFVAQGGGVSPDSKVCEELELQGRLYRMSKADAKRRSAQLVDEFELTTVRNRPVKTFSGGQRRRLDLALGLIHSPVLIFLDEPTTGLDPQSRANLWNHITRLRDETDMTVFLTTHYLDEADQLADRVLVMDEGMIVASGSPAELKSMVTGDRIALALAADRVADAIAVAAEQVAATDIEQVAAGMVFRVRDGNAAVPKLVRALDARGIDLRSIEVTRPSLDDVFFAVTGRSLRDEHSDMGASSAA
jgi:ABC-2 type transport system ATP-binding protein